MPTRDVQELTGVATRPIGVHLAWVATSTVVLGGVALARRAPRGRDRRG